ncbi:MAG TPA: hypothetical protein VGQ57_01270, partial [Polyangiaceae bacterium]|nr:hypothetical protein [Polyangiaceae bacterium]
MLALRRRVDWPVIHAVGGPTPAMVESSAPSELASLQSAFDDLLALDNVDAMLKRAVELALGNIGLKRAGLFLLDSRRELMLGTWGTDLEGNVVDEHHVMYDLGDNDREVFRRATLQGAPFTVIDNCPIVVQMPQETRVVGRGWVVCTPIRSARANVGMLFNDGGLDGEPADPAKQARAAILCCLLGT